jgi:hypothetical protein
MIAALKRELEALRGGIEELERALGERALGD